MLKDVRSEVKNRTENIATLQYRHIALASFRTDTESTSYIAFPYTRYTLEELLHTHVTMDKSHIRAVALPVSDRTNEVKPSRSSDVVQIFQAIKYLHEQALFYRGVNAQSIRVCGRTRAIMLGKYKVRSR
jgi:hypothetical protein